MSAKISHPEPNDAKAATAAPPNILPATFVHPGAIAIALGAAAYFVRACRVIFDGGKLSHHIDPHRQSTRSFGEFLNGDVNIQTGRITGRAALLQIAAMPAILVLGATLILGGEVWANDNRAVAPANIATNSVSGDGATLRSVSVEFPDPGRQFPGGETAEAINNNCLACHSAGMVLRQPHLSRAQWQAEVAKMRNAYKAPVAAEDVPAIVDYLASRGG